MGNKNISTDNVKNNHVNAWKNFKENLITGSIAGTTIAYSTFPAEALKKFEQTGQAKPMTANRLYMRIIQRYDGFKPYRGSLLFAVNIVPTTALQWVTNGIVQQYMPKDAKFHHTLAASAFCGIMGALTATAVENSIIRQQKLKIGARAVINDMLSQGVLRPWKTYNLIAVRDSIFTMWMMAVIPTLNEYINKNNLQVYSLPTNMFISSIGAALSHPFDTIASYKQQNHLQRSSWDVVKELYSKGGLMRFYSGFSYRLFLFFSFTNMIPMFKQTAEHYIYGKASLPTLFKNIGFLERKPGSSSLEEAGKRSSMKEPR